MDVICMGAHFMLQKVKEILSAYVPGEVENITEKTDLRGDLGLTSLELVDMAVAIEEEFNVTIPELTIVTGKTVGDILKLIEKK